MLRAIDDPNYAIGFVDRTEMECLELQGTFFDRWLFLFFDAFLASFNLLEYY